MAYDQMPMRSISDQLRREAIHWTLQHAESFTEHQITHDVKYQPLTPMRRIPLIVPALVISSFLCDTAIHPLTQQFAPNSYIRKDILLQTLDRRVTERMAHDSPLARMLHLIDRTMHADSLRRTGKRLIETGFSYIRSEAINGFQSRGGVDREEIGAETHIWSILDMCAVESEMSGALVGVVGEIDICYLR